MHAFGVHIAWPYLSLLLTLVLFWYVALYLKKRGRQMGWRIITACVLALFLILLQKNPLATDKEMLEYFSVHKDSLEYLVKKFYTTESGSRGHVMAFLEDKEVKDLMKKIGIWHVGETADGTWLPNPYEGVVSKRIEGLISDLGDKNKRARAHAILRHYKPISIQMEGNRFRTYWSGYGTAAEKTFIYFPEAPTVVGKWMQLPGFKEKPIRSRRRLVLPSLDNPGNPKDWEGSCTYRAIEQQWYLRLCISTASKS